MGLDDINGGLASQEAAQKKRMEEIEKFDVLDDMPKSDGEAVNYEEEKRLVRKLDFW